MVACVVAEADVVVVVEVGAEEDVVVAVDAVSRRQARFLSVYGVDTYAIKLQIAWRGPLAGDRNSESAEPKKKMATGRKPVL